jgi:hypothetical protein
MADLDPEEQALLDRHRAKKAQERSADDDKETWIKSGEHEAAVPYRKAKKFLADAFGIDLDDEPVQDPPGGKDAKDGDGDGDGEDGKGKTVRFGRRVS